MKRTYEVTIPFRKGPAYTGYALAENKADAQSLVLYAAGCQGFRGAHGKCEIIEIEERRAA